MKSVRICAASMKRASSTGRANVWLETCRYDTEFVKGNAKEVGCKEYFEPYKKCVMVRTICVCSSDRSVSRSCILMVNWASSLRTPICSTRMSLVPQSQRKDSKKITSYLSLFLFHLPCS